LAPGPSATSLNCWVIASCSWWRRTATRRTGENCCRLHEPQSRWPGVDVMITIFSDFWQFSAKKLAFFSKTNVMITIFAKFAVVWAKNTNIFAKNFRRKHLKNHNIGPRYFCRAHSNLHIYLLNESSTSRSVGNTTFQPLIWIF
jgi:hypothetical protein